MDTRVNRILQSHYELLELAKKPDQPSQLAAIAGLLGCVVTLLLDIRAAVLIEDVLPSTQPEA